MGSAERETIASLRNGEKRTEGLRWLGAGALALGLHAGMALLIRDARPEPLDAGGGDAITLDLDPVEGEAAKPDDAQPAVPARRGNLVPHFNRFRRPLLGVGEGTVRVGFAVDAEGRVTAVSTVTSPGDAALDAAAGKLIRRASPFPKPPPGLSGPALSFVVPIHNGRP